MTSTSGSGVTPAVRRVAEGLVDDKDFGPLTALGFVTSDGVSIVKGDPEVANGKVGGKLFDVERGGVNGDDFRFKVGVEQLAVTKDVKFGGGRVVAVGTNGDLKTVEKFVTT